MSEHEILESVLHDPTVMGYGPQCARVREFKWGRPFGVSDLVLFPSGREEKVVIIEAKCTDGELSRANPEAHAQVVGQLIKYYAAALRMGEQGVGKLRRAARELRSDLDANLERSSALQILDAKDEVAALAAISEGRPLDPREISLHIAVDKEAPAFAARLRPIRDVLQRHHGLRLRVWCTSDELAAGRRTLKELWVEDYGAA